MKRWGALKQERASWLEHWREISEYLLPRSGRFLTTDVNRGEKRHNSILDSTATRANRVLAAGLMAGMTSPARPWFRLKTPDKELNEHQPVKQWLGDVTEVMRDVFSHSNTYRALHMLYSELGAFGTAATIVLDDFENVIHHYPMTAGEFALALDHRGVPNALYREVPLTVAQMVRQFGREACSVGARNAFDNGNLDSWRTVLHVVEPREDRDLTMRDAKNMAFRSVYLELDSNEGKVLRESGFRRFRALTPRWELRPGDVYGSSPGMEALGDIKQLQHQQFRKAQAIDFQTLPPLQAPSSLVASEVNALPGGVTYHDYMGQGSGVRSLFDVRLDLSALGMDIQDVRVRIKQAFYEDLFLMLANDTRSNITAREIAERHEEKLLMLGPVLEGLHDELLGPLIEITFDALLEGGLLPEAPPELQGTDLNVQFVSMLAQAQRAVGLGSVDRLIGTVGSVAQFKPEVLDKLDGDQLVDAYADMLGVDPSIIVADDKVAIIREQRAQAQQAAAQAQAAPQLAQTAKTLSETDTQKPSMLSDAISMFSGYSGR
jgi:hypothetical protein